MIDLKGRGKHGNSLNLVPFVDLFSTLILFLMATAVFDQLASVPVNMGSEESASVKTDSGRAAGKKITSTVMATVTETEILLQNEGRQTKYGLDFVKQNGYREVADFMKVARLQHSDLRELVVNAKDKAKYADIVAVMDQALAQDFDQLVVTGEED